MQGMWDFVRDATVFLGGSAALVAASAWLARKWIEKNFSRDLETHKSNLQKEVERLKVQFGHQGRLIEHEFSTLRELWDKVHTALGATQLVASRMRSGASVYGLDAEQLDELLSHLDIPEHCKAEIRAAPDSFAVAGPFEKSRQNVFQKYEQGVRLSRALSTVHDARNYLIGQGPFISEVVFRSVMDLLDLSLKAVDEQVLLHQHPPAHGERTGRSSSDAFMARSSALKKEAEALTRKRLNISE